MVWLVSVIVRTIPGVRKPSGYLPFELLEITEKERLLSSDPFYWTPWIDEERARADLKDTMGIVRVIEHAFPSIYK